MPTKLYEYPIYNSTFSEEVSENVIGVAYFTDPSYSYDSLVSIAGTYDYRDDDQSGDVSLGENLLSFLSPSDGTFESAYLVARAASQLEQETLDPRYTELQTDVIAYALADGVEGLIEAVTAAATGPLTSTIASNVASGAVVPFFLKQGQQALIEDLVGAAVEPPNTSSPDTPFFQEVGTVNITDIDYKGDPNSLFFLADGLTFNGAANDVSFDPGLLLTTGGDPGTTNDNPAFSVDNDAPGDADLDVVASQAFAGAGLTNDAASVELAFDVKSDDVSGISLDVAFLSEEYPEFANTEYVDVGAVFLNGNNLALFDDDEERPLSVTQENIEEGNFFDNEPFNTPFSEGFDIQYDGVSKKLTVVGNIEQGENTLRIAVADTGDHVLDSAVFASNIRFLTNEGEGLFVTVDGSQANDVLEGGATNDFISGKGGGDLIVPGLGSDIIATGDGPDVVAGTLIELDGDTISDFSQKDSIRFLGTVFDQENLTITEGSLVLSVDANLDGMVESTVTLEGEFESQEVELEASGGNTELTISDTTDVNTVVGTAGRDNLRGTEAADQMISLGGSYDRMAGSGGADEFIFGAEATNGVRERDVISNFDVAEDSIVLRDGASVAESREQSDTVVLSLDDGNDVAYIRGDGVSLDTVNIVDENLLV